MKTLQKKGVTVKTAGKILALLTIVTVITVGFLISPLVSNVSAKDKVWRLKAQSFTVPGKYDCQWVVAEKFIELVKQHTNNRVLFSYHPSGELVGPREIWTAISAGTIDAGTTLDIKEGGTHPEFSFDVGAIWTIDEFFNVMHGGALDILNRQSTPENVRIIGYFPLMRYYAVAMRKGHVKTLADLKGKKIRGMGGASNVFLKEMGTGIVTLPMSEVPPALQTGVVEGILTGCAGLYAMHLWDVAPYFTATYSGNFGFFFMINNATYNEFSPEIKAGIDKAQLELEGWYKEWDKNFWKEIRPDVEAKGIKWYDLPDEESLRWREALTKASVEWSLKRNPELGKELLGVVERVTGRKILE
jgi:TRAP-type C4-dicarboxylate transport system substrate-binding protein